MRFAHLSDLHLSQVPVAGMSADADAILVHLVRDVSRIGKILDFVVVSGDMTDDADPASFRRFETMFADIGLPVYIVPGNHDGPAGYHQYRGASPQFANWDITNRTVELRDLRLIGVDTCIEGEPTGQINDDALRLIEHEVARRDAAPLVIVMHHPPVPPGLDDFDVVAQLDGCDQLIAIVQQSKTPQIILSGHVHRPYQGRVHGLACFVAGSPTSAYTSDFPFGASPIRPQGLQDFYFVHEIDQTGRHVVTPQHFSIPGLDGAMAT